MKPNRFMYTQEMIDFVLEYQKNHTWAETNLAFNKKFNLDKKDVVKVIREKLQRKKQKNTTLKYYSEEEDNWIIKNYNKFSRRELCIIYNKKFNKEIGYRSLENYCSKLIKKGLIKRSLEKPKDRFLFTKEMIQWLIDNKANYTCVDLTNEFNKKFNANTTQSSIKKLLTHKKTNLSKKGIRAKIDSEIYHKCEVGCIIQHQGSNYIKISKKPQNESKYYLAKYYKRYADYVYEKHYNIKIPENKKVLHLDGNLLNDNIENLMLVDKITFHSVNRQKKYLVEIDGLIEANAFMKEIELKFNERGE